MRLTRRELEVARLVSQGLTDREIASKLFLAKRTVEWHLEQIREKLGFTSRAQIAVWFVRGGPMEVRESGVSAPVHPNNLPIRATSFIGRARDLVGVSRLLASTRLLTLTGAAGVGKTRLALQVAAQELPRFPDGAWFVDLGAIGDPGFVSRAACEVLGIRHGPDQVAVDALAGRLRGSRLLLVLDNCEHVVEASARLADRLLRSCPGVTLIATSRESLQVEGETRWRVLPLSTPDAPAAKRPEGLLRYDAVALFIDRAFKAAPDRRLQPESAVAVGEICRRLDGIPLAIEMAAARASLMTPEQILARLEDRFRLLMGGSRVAARRQQTLNAALDWSHALLTEDEKRLFRRLSVFAGGFTLEAAEAVGPGSDLDPRSVLELLARLVDKSLVVPVASSGAGVRYQMLMTVQEFARERLLESGEAGLVRDAHLKYYLILAEAAEPKLVERSLTTIDQVDVEIDNLRLAMAWAKTSDIDASLRMAIALDQFWRMRCRFTEGHETLTQVLEPEGGDLALRLNATAELALLCVVIGDVPGADRYARQAIDMGRLIGPCAGVARALAVAGYHSRWQGSVSSAQEEFEASVRVGSQLSDRRWQFLGRQGLIVVAFDRGDVSLGRRLGNELLELFGEAFDPWAHCLARVLLGICEVNARDLGIACEHLDVRLRIAAHFAFHRPGSNGVRATSALEASRGRFERSLRLAGAATSLRNHFPFGLAHSRPGDVWPPDLPIAPEKTAALIAEGESLSPDEVYEYARSSVSSTSSGPPVGLLATRPFAID